MVTTRRQHQQEEAKRKREATLESIWNDMRKRGRTLSLTLSNDITREILSTVPVEDLLRFKFACKSWYTLLHDPFFINLHLNQSISNYNFAFMVCSNFKVVFSVDFDISSSSFKLKKPVKIDCPFEAFQIYGSCNGIFLVCIFLRSYKICLWNPTTGEYKDLSDTLPKNPKHTQPFLHVVYWLGYDLSRDDYKVIRMSYYHKGTITDIHVYSLRTNSCKKFHNVPYFILGLVYPKYSNSGGIHLNGAIHWLGKHVSDTNDFLLRIVSFDLANDEFKDLLLLPNVLLNDKSKRLGIFEECLCIYQVNKDSYIDVFIMKEYGVKESWMKILSINDLRIYNMRHFKAICITNNGKLLVQWDHKNLALYDPKHGGRKCGDVKIEGLSTRSYLNIGTYVKSLVSLEAIKYF
ncbi:F-box protein cpr1 [Thalictrum thalictroides]|uniref:F-box protein cpr1 n=1 Tax=Thalictrum thalictroides TaxID=46969 RepID=A0A7J6V8U1_THATH|nr:F-box protein cpr1 [Thalictrum thalictroides]